MINHIHRIASSTFTQQQYSKLDSRHKPRSPPYRSNCVCCHDPHPSLVVGVPSKVMCHYPQTILSAPSHPTSFNCIPTEGLQNPAKYTRDFAAIVPSDVQLQLAQPFDNLNHSLHSENLFNTRLMLTDKNLCNHGMPPLAPTPDPPQEILLGTQEIFPLQGFQQD